MLNITLTISIIFLILSILCFVLANVNFKKALEYTELEQEENSLKRGLLYLLFSKYADLFARFFIIMIPINFLIWIY